MFCSKNVLHFILKWAECVLSDSVRIYKINLLISSTKLLAETTQSN